MPEFDDFDPPVHNPHDAAFKAAFRRRDMAEEFFRHYLPEEIRRDIDFSCLEAVNKSYVDEKLRDRHSDMVYKTTLSGREVLLYLLFEHQSTVDPLMAFRLLCYMVLIWRDYVQDHPNTTSLPMIFPMVLYHGKRKWTAPIRFADLVEAGDGFGPYLPDFAYRLYDLRDYTDDMLMAGGAVPLSVALLLMKHIFDDDFWDTWVDGANALAGLENRDMALTFLEWALRYAFHARDDDKNVMNDHIDQGIAGFGDERARRMAMTIAERLRQEGKEEGKLMGLQEGKLVGLREGMGKGRAAILLKLLTKRFGHVTPVLERRLDQSRPETMDQFGEAILDFKDLKDAETWWEEREKRGHA